MQINLGSITGTDLLKNTAIVTLLVIVIFQRECHQNTPLASTTVKSGSPQTITKYVHDTVPVSSKPQRPLISYIDTGSTRYITVASPQKIDTPVIVRQYLKTYQYVQQFKATQYLASFKAYVSHDSIYSPDLSVVWLQPTESISQITTPIVTEKFKVFLGLHVGGAISQFDLGPEVWLLTQNDHLYGLNNDLALKQPNVELHVGWKLHW